MIKDLNYIVETQSFSFSDLGLPFISSLIFSSSDSGKILYLTLWTVPSEKMTLFLRQVSVLTLIITLVGIPIKSNLSFDLASPKDEKARRIVRPEIVGEMEYRGKRYLGMKGALHSAK